MNEGKGRTDYRVYRFTPAEWVKYLAIGAGLGLFAVWVCYRSLYACPAAAVLAFLYVRAKKKSLAEVRRQTLDYHFRDFLTSLHTNMLTGYSLENSVKSSVKDVEKLYGKKDLLYQELREIVRQMSFGKQVEELFRDFGRRSCVEDIRIFGEVVSIAKRTGGNMGQILETTWRNLSGKIDTQREIDTILAARRYEQKVMNFMPAGIILYLRLTFRGFVERMYGNLTGIVVMSGCLGVYLFAIWLGKRMMGGSV